jgi:hypothetical protein
MFLNRAQLQAITGYKYRKLQIRWLEKRGWAFSVNSKGEVQVLEDEMRRNMIGGNAERQATPNFAALLRAR